MEKDKKYLYLFKAFVVDQILEIRKSEISKNCDYTLYDITGAQEKELKTGNTRADQMKELEDAEKRRIKTIEKAILSSGTARKKSGSNSVGSNYSSPYPNSRTYNPNNSNTTSDGGGWIIFIIIAIILFLIFSNMK